MFGSLGMPELIIIGCIVALIFGPRQLPKMGRSIAETVREFRKVGKELQDAVEDADDKRS